MHVIAKNSVLTTKNIDVHKLMAHKKEIRLKEWGVEMRNVKRVRKE